MLSFCRDNITGTKFRWFESKPSSRKKTSIIIKKLAQNSQKCIQTTRRCCNSPEFAWRFRHLTKILCYGFLRGKRVKTAPSPSVRQSVCPRGSARGSSKAVRAAAGDAHRPPLHAIRGPRKFRSDCSEVQHSLVRM